MAEKLLQRFPALRRLMPAGRRRRVPFVQQTAAADCGAACLAMVLAFHGKQLSLDEVREVVGVNRDGSDAQRLITAGSWFGLRGRGLQVPEIDELQYLGAGSILHWRFRHFVVFERLTSRGAVIVDPAAGRRQVSRDELRTAFTGVAISFEPREDFEPGERRRRGLARYLRPMLDRSGLLVRVLVISVLVQLLALALPILTGLVVDRVVPRGDYHLLSVLSAGLAAIVLFDFLSSLIRSHLLLHLRTHLDARITLDFLDHLVDLPYAFFQQRSAGDLMMRLNSNATIRETLTSGALSTILDGTLVSLYLIVLFVTHAPMALVVLLLGLLRIALFLVTRKRHQDLMSESLQVQARSRSYQVEMLAGIETLKASGAERRAVEHWSNLFVDELNVALARGRLSAIFDSLLKALGTASPFIVLVFGAVQVLQGELSLGTMLALSALAAGFLGPLTSLVSTALQFQLLGSYLERINDVLDTPKEQQRETVKPAGKLAGRITLDGVTFRYGPAAPIVVDDVSVDVAPGSFVALVGASGAGKTTLANLLLGLYQPTAGRILYDGVELRHLDLRTVRRQLGIVNQQIYLFGASIRDNISLADPTLPLARVIEAAKRAAIHDEIMAMPMGYETILADGGATLSGGQRQRLALARALVHRPAILLLDEATSHLDTATERRIQDELALLNATRIVIAHRLSTIRAADLILVMEAGKIVERGRHQELAALGGKYAELLAAQLEVEQTSAR
ncbi:MAG: peptidase domain-containing ABC transporter [Acidobacteria bacterium]|nr:MAG: peptidase domain-containing ABC transporter [Acidobacteriota bacterium]